MNSRAPSAAEFATYQIFLESKRILAPECGLSGPFDLNPQLFPFQRDIVTWALRKGRAAVFADTGLGKTLMQLEWARNIPGDSLILAPLAVSYQTAREGEKIGVHVNVCKTSTDLKPGINITNYERLHHFQPTHFQSIVLDESSILKAFGGVMRREITDFARDIRYRLACTATPAPNDLIELTNHAEFLDVMSGKEIIALFFRNDGNTTHAWRLKHHAHGDFWRWVSSWAVAVRKPSDLGYGDGEFILPELNMNQIIVDGPAGDTLFPMEALSLQERQAARRDSTPERVKACADLVNASGETWLIWCGLNIESSALAKSIPDAVEVVGSDSAEFKERAIREFSEGKTRVLVSKPSICGFGMNWQHCANMAFVGLSDSYEQFYQAVRRCWRFGQKRPVNVHIITAETEGAVVRNINRKQRDVDRLMDALTKEVCSAIGNISETKREVEMYSQDEASGEGWRMLCGDSCERIKEIESESIGLTIFSPPFPGMYAYTNSPRDIGNTRNVDEMIEHFRFLAPELLRISMPGRMCCIHLLQLTAMKSREGYIGLHDYRGRVIDMMLSVGWVYAGEVTIDKNPQVQATRNKERGLLFKSLATDSAMMRMALADYLIYFRKSGENPVPIRAGVSSKYNDGGGWITEQEWIEWAAPVWYRQTKGLPGGIRETDVLNTAAAKSNDDERHICPLQLGVIERAVKLWSAPGDTVFSPFAGIGSELFVALEHGRKGLGIELKRSYFEQACRNLEKAKSIQGSLFA